MNKRIPILSFALLSYMTCAAFGLSALAQQSPQPGTSNSGKSSQRQWPSKSLPEQPINVRICSCRYNGQSIPIGKTICMKFDGRHVKATCDSIVNNPSWSITTQECPSS